MLRCFRSRLKHLLCCSTWKHRASAYLEGQKAAGTVERWRAAFILLFLGRIGKLTRSKNSFFSINTPLSPAFLQGSPSHPLSCGHFSQQPGSSRKSDKTRAESLICQPPDHTAGARDCKRKFIFLKRSFLLFLRIWLLCRMTHKETFTTHTEWGIQIREVQREAETALNQAWKLADPQTNAVRKMRATGLY